jgi:gas vesicle protein
VSYLRIKIMDYMNTGKTVVAVLAGVVAGAALGILLAPEKGSDTRKRIVKKGGDLANLVNDKIDQKFDELLSTVTGKAKKPAQPANASAGKNELV